MSRARLGPYLRLAVLVLGTGLGIGLGLSEAPGGQPAVNRQAHRPPPPAVPTEEPGCPAPRSSPTVTLSDTVPMPTISVGIGTVLVVLVPPWHFGTATDVHVGNPAVVSERCSVVLAGGGRRAVLNALAPGHSYLTATITPATNAMMPAWSAKVTVVARRR